VILWELWRWMAENGPPANEDLILQSIKEALAALTIMSRTLDITILAGCFLVAGMNHCIEPWPVSQMVPTYSTKAKATGSY